MSGSDDYLLMAEAATGRELKGSAWCRTARWHPHSLRFEPALKGEWRGGAVRNTFATQLLDLYHE